MVLSCFVLSVVKQDFNYTPAGVGSFSGSTAPFSVAWCGVHDPGKLR